MITYRENKIKLRKRAVTFIEVMLTITMIVSLMYLSLPRFGNIMESPYNLKVNADMLEYEYAIRKSYSSYGDFTKSNINMLVEPYLEFQNNNESQRDNPFKYKYTYTENGVNDITISSTTFKNKTPVVISIHATVINNNLNIETSGLTN